MQAAGQIKERRGARETGKEDWIGRQLRRVYDEAAAEPIPDDLRLLLDQLDQPSDGESDRGKPKTP